MFILNYFASLNPAAFTNALPGNVAQGLIWGIMALGVYITFRLLDFADLTVDGSFATGGAVTVMMTINGHNIWISLLCACIAGLLAGVQEIQKIVEELSKVSDPVFSKLYQQGAGQPGAEGAANNTDSTNDGNADNID